MTKTARSYPLLIMPALLALSLPLTLALSRGVHSQAQTVPTQVITRIVTATRTVTPTSTRAVTPTLPPKPTATRTPTPTATPLPVRILFVDTDATGANNGASWEDAFTTLQAALDTAGSGDAIWVAAGTYTPTHEFSPGDPRSATFQLKNGIALYGGFNPTLGDVDWEDRDWVNNVTILSGDIGAVGDSSDNSYHVFYHPPELALDRTATLDGFTVTGGNANSGFSPNHAGGGMFNDKSSPALTNCTFSGNSANWGGGICNDRSSPLVTNCTFSGNSAGWGGGMYNLYSSAVVINCTFSGNLAELGGGMYNETNGLTLTNCTFSGNSASNDGGGMYNYHTVRMANSILWGDSPNAISGSANVTYSDVQGSWEGTGNIDADPLFANPGSGDYHLGPGSPCIDAGTGDAPNLPAHDFEGDPRVMDGNRDGTAVVDMGIDEVLANIVYVDQDAAGDNNGSSWEDAYTELQPALENAKAGAEIWVAVGTYTPTYESSPGDPRSATFQLKNGVALYGGFDPTVGDTGWEDRDWEANPTILSGDLGSPGVYDDNSYHVFYHPSELALNGTAILDGFTVTGGNANTGAEPQNAGGGMHNYGSSPTVANCAFLGNSADWGGGMYNGQSSPVVTNCTFSGNSAYYNGGDGGGMANQYYGSSPVVTNCTFSGNSAAEAGGGMTNFGGSSPVVTNCTFWGNSAVVGGGMYNWNSHSVVSNCTFLGNSASIYGGGMHNHYSPSTEVTNCTFGGNSAGRNGGGMANDYDSPSVVTNCILWGDTPDEIYNDASQPAVTYSDIEGGYDGTGNIDADPLFMNPASGDYHLGPGSPCIDAGTNAASNLPTHDFDGDPRVMDGNRDGMAVVDMGVDEVYGYALYLPLIFRGY